MANPLAQIALVTGGTGYIGYAVVNTLLSRGHTVNTTVRSLKNEAKIQPLRDLQAAYPGKLVLFEADLLQEGAFNEAIKGCTVVYHVASPFLTPMQIKDGMKDCVEPALNGTRNVLNSVNETESVVRVVMTSSIAAMFTDRIEVADKTIDESVWNVTNSVAHDAYTHSKVEAERLAWVISEAQSRWDLVVINPSLVIGPSPTLNSDSGSLFMLEGMYAGANQQGTIDISFPLVDVRDVALAHVLAGEKPSASGRYLISHGSSHNMLTMANFVRPFHKKPEVLPTWSFPVDIMLGSGRFTKEWLDGNYGIGYKIDARKSQEQLGLVYRPLEQTFKEHYESWLSKQEVKEA